MPRPGASGTSAKPPATRRGACVTSSARPVWVSVSPQATLGMTAATCSAAAQPMLDSPVLQETLRMRAARDCLPYEHPKLAIVAHVEDFGNRLEAEVARRKAYTQARIGQDRPCTIDATATDITPPAPPV